MFLGLLGFHHLDEQLPRWKIAPSNGVPHVLVVKVRVGTSQAFCLFTTEVADALDRAKMEFAVSEPAIIGHQLKCMDSKTADPTDRVRKASGAEQMHQSVHALRLIDMEVPELES